MRKCQFRRGPARQDAALDELADKLAVFHPTLSRSALRHLAAEHLAAARLETSAPAERPIQQKDIYAT